MTNQAYKPMEGKTFVVSTVGEVRHSRRGDPFLECETDLGLIAIWGGKLDRANLDMVRQAATPFQLTCETITPQSRKYAYWVPETARIGNLTELKTATLTTPPKPRDVTAADLATWRSSVVGILRSLDSGARTSPDESVAGRIGRLARAGRIPRETAALMRTITEMRNTAEYEGKVLSAAESSAVSAAWEAVREWAAGQRLPGFE
jgi:hypothetical protein